MNDEWHERGGMRYAIERYGTAGSRWPAVGGWREHDLALVLAGAELVEYRRRVKPIALAEWCVTAFVGCFMYVGRF